MPELKFLNLVKPVMFLIPEIKPPMRAVRNLNFNQCRLVKETNSYGLPSLFSFT